MGCRSLLQLEPNHTVIHSALYENYAILLEAWQTWARSTEDSSAYETAAKMGKHKHISAEEWRTFAQKADARITNLTPETYCGLAQKITEESVVEIREFLKK